tara:strand:- start:256 stop:1593 length:1338 start_codon:yes stop_codon:yes gene_type:complete
MFIKYLLTIYLFSFSSIVLAQVNIGPNRFFIYEGNDSLSLPYYSNHSLDDYNNNTLVAIVYLHGQSRNADDYYDNVSAIVNSAGHMDSTIIIAPQFLRSEDLNDNNSTDNVFFWTNTTNWTAGYLSGNTSSQYRPFRMSSYAIMDSLLHEIALKNPMLKQIVFAGFSAGGQFVNRYIGGNNITEYLLHEYYLPIRFVVGSPSSYLYMNNERRVTGSTDQFAIPSGCNGYNEYKYGLDYLNSYMSLAGEDSIRSRYERRNVVYLVGSSDDGGTTDCESIKQGSDRYERSIIYYNYLQYYYSNQIINNHQHAIVPNTDHDNYYIFNSACGRKALFGYGDCNDLDFLNTDYFEIANDFTISYNVPNPFNAKTNIYYETHLSKDLDIIIYNMMGNLIKKIRIQNQNYGINYIAWDGTDQNKRAISSGIYFYQIVTNQKIIAQNKMILLK